MVDCCGAYPPLWRELNHNIKMTSKRVVKKYYTFFVAVTFVFLLVAGVFLYCLSVWINNNLPQTMGFSEPVPLASAWLGWNSPENAPQEIHYQWGVYHSTQNVEELSQSPAQEVERLIVPPYDEVRNSIGTSNGYLDPSDQLDSPDQKMRDMLEASWQSFQQNGVMVTHVIFRNTAAEKKARAQYLAKSIAIQRESYVTWWDMSPYIQAILD